MQTEKKLPVKLIAIVLAAIALVAVIFAVSTQSNKKDEAPAVGGVLEEGQDVLPTVDASVKVTLVPADGGREVVLAVSGIPSDTDSIDYELSYEEKTKGLQGVIGVLTPSGKDETEKKVTLGTCSSGRCVYHEVVGKVKLTLKFSGSYGEKIFEKEYDI